MRPSTISSRRPSILNPKPSKPTFFKFILNDSFQLTLRIKDPQTTTFAHLLALLAAEHIITIVDGQPTLQSSPCIIKSQTGLPLTADPFNLAAFVVQLQAQAFADSPSLTEKKRSFVIRPSSARRKLFERPQLDLLNSARSTLSRSKAIISPTPQSDKPFSLGEKFRLRRAPSPKGREKLDEVRSSQLIRENPFADASVIEKAAETLTPPTRQKPFRKTVKKLKPKVQTVYDDGDDK